MALSLHPEHSLGATYLGEGRCQFVVWAPLATGVSLHVVAPIDHLIPMAKDERGYFRVTAGGVHPGSQYLYRLDGERERPDPASRFQPKGVHGPSEVIDFRFPWTDGPWTGVPLRDYIIYELHVGTFTPRGTFDAAIDRLGYLGDLGITAVEIMPVAQFPGRRNWGYDGVYPFAVQDSYGGPLGLKRLVDAAHRSGLAVILDVVYNHLGPEGNYLWDYGHYFTDRYKTPWGSAINFDGPHGDEARRFFVENALMWIGEFHVDALRLDAVHAIKDFSARTFLEDLAEAVHRRADETGRRAYLIAESDLNDPRLVRPPEVGGHGLDAQWSDDFHHALHVALTGERSGYYSDFGQSRQLARALERGWVYGGDYSVFRKRRHGRPMHDVPARRLVVCSQNHDQVGNRMLGERASALVSFDALKLAAAALLTSPFLPLIFMGEEYGEPAPFLYFVSHGDPDLVAAVRKGRREEFAAFSWKGEPPDPQSEATFERSRLDLGLHRGGRNQVLHRWYRELIRLRKTIPAISAAEEGSVELLRHGETLVIRRWTDNSTDVVDPRDGHQGSVDRTHGRDVAIVLSFSPEDVRLAWPIEDGAWILALDSGSSEWREPESDPDQQSGANVEAAPQSADPEDRLDSASSSLPKLIGASGTTLTLRPWAFALYVRTETR